MSYEVKQGNIFGRIGKGIGQGLSEQIPKEIERHRLSSGLKKFEQESHGLNPVQQATRLLGIPGLTAEHLYTLAPLLRQQAQRDEGSTRGSQLPQGARPGMGQPSDVGSPSTLSGLEPSGEQQDLSGERGSLKSLDLTRAQLTPLIRKSPEELFKRQQQLSRENPYTYPTPQDALPFANSEEDTRLSNLQSQQQVGQTADAIQKDIRNRFINTIGGEKTFDGIPGTVQSKLLRNVESILADPKNKLSEQQIIDREAEKGKRIAQATTNLNAKSKAGWLTRAGAIGGPVGLAASAVGSDYIPKRIKQTIESTRKVYHDIGADEEFSDMISGKFDLSAPSAAYLTFPRENTQLNNYLVGISPSKGPVNPMKSIEAADVLSKNLTPKDSILSYAWDMKKKGLDPKVFFDRIFQNASAGIFKPNAMQQNELQKGYPVAPSMGDLYLFSLMNQDKLVR